MTRQRWCDQLDERSTTKRFLGAHFKSWLQMAFLFNLFALCFLGKIIQTKVYAGLYHKVGLYSSQLQIKRATTFFCKVEWNSEIEFFCPSFVYNDCYAMYLSIWSHTHIWRLFEPFLLFVFHIHATIMCQEIVWEGFFSWSLSIFFFNFDGWLWALF